MFKLLVCDNCSAEGEARYHVVIVATGERFALCRACYAAGALLAGKRIVLATEWEYSPAAAAYTYVPLEVGTHLARPIFRPGDTFPLLLRVGNAYQLVRVIVYNPPTERGGASVSGHYDLPTLSVTPEEAELIQWQTRGGGSAEDDAP